jgi:hypothetical protein
MLSLGGPTLKNKKIKIKIKNKKQKNNIKKVYHNITISKAFDH